MVCRLSSLTLWARIKTRFQRELIESALDLDYIIDHPGRIVNPGKKKKKRGQMCLLTFGAKREGKREVHLTHCINRYSDPVTDRRSFLFLVFFPIIFAATAAARSAISAKSQTQFRATNRMPPLLRDWRRRDVAS